MKLLSFYVNVLVLGLITFTSSSPLFQVAKLRIPSSSKQDIHMQTLDGEYSRRSPASINSTVLEMRGGARPGVEVNRAKGLVLLAICVVLEIFATISMKWLEVTGNKKWYLGVFGGYFLCFGMFPMVLEHLPLGLAYATWCGLGMAIISCVATLYFGESMTRSKALLLLLIGVGVTGINLLEGGH